MLTRIQPMRQHAIDSLVKAFPRHPDPSLVAKKLLLNTDQDAFTLVRACGYFYVPNDTGSSK